MNWIKRLPLISCRAASRLISEKMDRRLKLSERMALGFHLAMCRGCFRMAKQLRSLRKLFRAYRKRSLSRRPLTQLSPAQKEQIRQKLRENFPTP